LSPRGNIGDGRSASDFCDGLIGEGEHLHTGILITGDQNGLSLLIQRGGGNLLYSPFVGLADGGIQAARVHVRRDHKRHPLKHGVPGGDVQGR